MPGRMHIHSWVAIPGMVLWFAASAWAQDEPARSQDDETSLHPQSGSREQIQEQQIPSSQEKMLDPPQDLPDPAPHEPLKMEEPALPARPASEGRLPDSLFDLTLEDLMDLDMTVITSGKQEMKLREVPESIWVITAEEIRRSGAVALPDVLRLVPGVTVSQLSHANYAVSIRDYPYSAVCDLLLLVDSKPINLSLHDFVLWPIQHAVLDNIERIEILKGPGSTLYGSNALTGIINIITKKPSPGRASVRALAGTQLGSGLDNKWGNVYASGTWSDTWDELGLSTAVSARRSAPWEESKYIGMERSSEVMVDASANLSATWRARSGTSLTFRGAGAYGSGDFFILTRSPMEYAYFSADLELEHTGLLTSADQLNVRIHHREHFGDAVMGLDAMLPTVDFDFRETSTDFSLLYRVTLADRFTTSLGLEDDYQTDALEFLDPAGKKSNTLAAVVQEKIRPFSSLILSGALQLDVQTLGDDARSVLLGQGSAVFTPHPDHIFRFVFGQGFKKHTLLGRYIDLSFFDGMLPFLKGDTSIKDEKMNSLEAGYQLELQKHLTFSVNGYHSWYANDVRLTLNPAGVPVILLDNSKKIVKLYGFEAAFSAVPRPWMMVRAGYSLGMSNRPFYQEVPSQPFHQLTSSCFLTPTERLDIHLSLYFTSFFNQNQLPTGDPLVVNPIDILSLRIAYQVFTSVKVVFQGTNVLNLRWGDTFRKGATDAENAVQGTERIGTRLWLGMELDL